MMSTSFPLRSWLVLLLLVTVAFVLHLRVLDLSFFSDDFSVIYRIGVKQDLGTGSFFRPLPDWTLYFNYRVAGPSPIGFRSVNVLLLAVNAWMVLLLGRNLFGDDAKGSLAAIAALLFVCYPFHSEPQLWIIGRSTAMATMFTLLALVAATSKTNEVMRCILVGVFGAIGAMCYELALLLPLLLVPLVLIAPSRERRVGWAMVVITAAVAGSNLLLRSLFTGHVANAYGASFFNEGLRSYLDRAVKVMARLFLPPDPDPARQLLLFAMLVVVLSVIIFFLARLTKREPRGRSMLLVLTSLVIIACGIGMIGGVSTRTSESDRFLYLPSAFLCMLIAVAIGRLFRGWWRTMVVCVLLSASVLQLVHGQRNWTTASNVIERIVRETPHAPSTARLFITGLPGDVDGAFIFRHGYYEALVFAGRDTARTVRADTVLSHVADARGVPAWSFEHPEDTVYIKPVDRLEQWTGSGFRRVPHPALRF